VAPAASVRFAVPPTGKLLNPRLRTPKSIEPENVRVPPRSSVPILPVPLIVLPPGSNRPTSS
jgi:hypothetical protein